MKDCGLLLFSLLVLYYYFFLSLTVASSPVPPRGGFIGVDGKVQRLIDEDGRERIFHGTNVVYKAPPYHPKTDTFDFQYSFVEKDAQLLKSWGLNSIRLGVMWPGVEPQRGNYNETYLAIMDSIIDVSSQYGIYSIIDMHQDDFSEHFCGEGVPLWASISSVDEALGFPEPLAKPFKSNASGLPEPKDCDRFNWPEYYFTFALCSATQNLYDNYQGIQDAFAEYWKKLATVWKANEWVLGYEFMNEPWAGNIYKDPLLLVPGFADQRNLQPMYEKLHKAIRSVDEDHCVFFESVTWDDFLVGFTDTPGGEEYKNRSILSYHVYVPPELNVKWAFDARMRELKKLQCGGFCTETGMSETADEADRRLQSWMGWEYKAYVPMTGWDYGFWNSDGSLNLDAIRFASRTYAPAVAGSTVSQHFDAVNKTFTLVYILKRSCQLPTEIYLNEELHYPNGYAVDVTPSSMVKIISPEINFLWITHLQEAQDGTAIRVVISPRET